MKLVRFAEKDYNITIIPLNSSSTSKCECSDVENNSTWRKKAEINIFYKDLKRLGIVSMVMAK